MAETDNSIAQRHAGFHAPEETIFDLIKEHTSYTAVKRTKIVKGYDSEVYDVATREGASFIVKIKHYNAEHPSYPLHALVEGYGDHEMFRDRFPERLLLHKLGLHMGHLAHEVRGGMRPEAESRTKRLGETLRNLTKSL